MGQNADFGVVYNKLKKPAHGLFFKNRFPKGGGKFIKGRNGEAPESIKIFRRGGFAGFIKLVIKPAKAFGNFTFTKKIIKSGGKFLSACAKKPFSKVFEGIYDSFTKFVKLNKFFLVLGFYFAEAFGASGKGSEKSFPRMFQTKQ